MHIVREYIREVKLRKHRKKGREYQEAEVHLTISLPLELAGKKVKLRVVIEPLEEENTNTNTTATTGTDSREGSSNYTLDKIYNILLRAYKESYRRLFDKSWEEDGKYCTPIPVANVYEDGVKAGIIPRELTLQDIIRYCEQLNYIGSYKYPRFRYEIHPKYLDKPEIGATICFEG